MKNTHLGAAGIKSRGERIATELANTNAYERVAVLQAIAESLTAQKRPVLGELIKALAGVYALSDESKTR